MNCKHCGSSSYSKFGKTNNKKQRYKCRDCGRSFRGGDCREKYSKEVKFRAINYYLRGARIRSIASCEGTSGSLVLHWIRRAGVILKDYMDSIKVPNNAKEIEILEIDEMFSYVKKKLPESTFGLLLIGTEIKLLTMK